MRQKYHYKITVESLDPAKEGGLAKAPMEFNVQNHDNILSVAKRLRENLQFDAATTNSFTLGLKLLTEVMLRNREDPLFDELKPAMVQFMQKLKNHLQDGAVEQPEISTTDFVKKKTSQHTGASIQESVESRIKELERKSLDRIATLGGAGVVAGKAAAEAIPAVGVITPTLKKAPEGVTISPDVLRPTSKAAPTSEESKEVVVVDESNLGNSGFEDDSYIDQHIDLEASLDDSDGLEVDADDSELGAAAAVEEFFKNSTEDAHASFELSFMDDDEFVIGYTDDKHDTESAVDEFLAGTEEIVVLDDYDEPIPTQSKLDGEQSYSESMNEDGEIDGIELLDFEK